MTEAYRPEKRFASPSPRRAWIEMSVCGCSVHTCVIVALPTEGVD